MKTKALNAAKSLAVLAALLALWALVCRAGLF